MLPALEEMAGNLGQKTKDLEAKRKEVDTLIESNDKLQNQTKSLNSQISNLKDGELKLRKLVIESLRDCRNDLVTAATDMNSSITVSFEH